MVLNHYQQEIALANHTSLNLGGRARLFCRCESVAQLQQSLQDAKSQQLPLLVLGGGSNLIIPDSGFPGIVAQVNLRGIVFHRQDQHTMQVTAAAGENWDSFVQCCIDHHLTGLECLSGIPGYVGATPIQNVGAYGQEVKNTLLSVTAIDRRSGDVIEFNNADCEFSYRSSRFKGRDKNRYIITQVTFQLGIATAPEIFYPELHQQLAKQADWPQLPTGKQKNHRVRNTVIAIRRKKSMVLDPKDPNSRSAGSFFTNPIISPAIFERIQSQHRNTPIPHYPADKHIKIPAAWLIEQAGFSKGFRDQGVGISANHTLALINIDGTTQQLLTLAEKIKTRVQQHYGIELKQEPVLAQPGM